MERIRKNLPSILLVILIVLTVFIVYGAFKTIRPNQYLKVVFLDVGQGDAIYIEAPNGRQMLVDGGPDAKLLSSLAKVMPFADRSIDVVIETHPDNDHIGGLPILLDNYKVGQILENGVVANSAVYSLLESKIVKNKIEKVIARRGQKIILDPNRNIYFEILFPDRDVSSLDSNDGSIVGKLVYGNDSFLLTGDATLYTENQLEWNEKAETLKSDVLKLGHHGSRTSSSLLWLESVQPRVAIISAGLNNKYGHPSQEVLDRLLSLNIPFLNTAKQGNIIFESDGVNLIY